MKGVKYWNRGLERCGTSILEVIQNPSRYSPEQPHLIKPSLSWMLDYRPPQVSSSRNYSVILREKQGGGFYKIWLRVHVSDVHKLSSEKSPKDYVSPALFQVCVKSQDDSQT